MNLQIPTSTVCVTITKVAVRIRYDIPGYESGGLTWADIENKDGHRKDGYLVEHRGEVIGLVYKWDDGEWTAQTVSPGYASPGVGYAFGSSLYSAPTRHGALVRLLRSTKFNNT